MRSENYSFSRGIALNPENKKILENYSYCQFFIALLFYGFIVTTGLGRKLINHI